MEKVIYRNKKNGKIGTLVQKNEKFRQYILEVDGQNVPYSSATIKRWWEVVTEDKLPAASEDVVTSETEKVNTEEITSVSEPQADAVVEHSKSISQNSPQSNKEDVSQKPKKKSKETSPTPKTKGPDMEVFSYICKAGVDVGLEHIPVSKQRQIILGKVTEKNGKSISHRHIKFYIGNKTIRVFMKKTDGNKDWAKKNKLSFTLTEKSMGLVFDIKIEDYKQVDMIIKQAL